MEVFSPMNIFKLIIIYLFILIEILIFYCFDNRTHINDIGYVIDIIDIMVTIMSIFFIRWGT